MLAACGIGPTRAIDDYAAVRADKGGSGSSGGPSPRSSYELKTPAALVYEYLRASALDSGKRREMLSSYLSDAALVPPVDGKLLNVVRVPRPEEMNVPSTLSDGSQELTVNVQPIGVLRDDGLLDIPADQTPVTYQFVAIMKDGQLMLSKVPPVLLLADTALDDYYFTRALHFWSGDTLVQDLRYIPRALTMAQISSRLVNWLYGSPAAWLEGSVKRPPTETKTNDAVVLGADGTMVVNLAQPAPEGEAGLLAQQLAETLVVPPFSSLRITVNGQTVEPKFAPKTLTRTLPARRYAVVNNVLTRLKEPAIETVSPVITPSELNKNVALAAVAAREEAIVLVYTDQRVVIVRRGKAMAVEGLPAGTRSQPIWVDGGRTLIVQTGENVTHVDAVDGKVLANIKIAGLSQLSADPEGGRRLLMVINGALYLTSRNDQSQIAIDKKQPIPTGFSSVQSAAFRDVGTQNRLIVAGVETGGVYLAAMNFDGSRRVRYDNAKFPAGSVIRHLVARNGSVLYEVQNGEALEAQQSGPQLKLADKVDVPPPLPAQVVVKAPSFEG
jgi:hypothetical protein